MKAFTAAILSASILALVLMGYLLIYNPPQTLVHKVGYICTAIALVLVVASNSSSLKKILP